MTTIPESMRAVRVNLADKFLKGSGVEIGALDCPTPVPVSACVRYVDRVSTARLREYYPELAERQLVEPDIIEDGEKLTSIPDESLDFIIANHMLEHCENPLGTIQVHFSRLRPGGVLYYAIPDKRHCFDQPRPLTSFSHLLEDEKDGGEESRWRHYLEWSELVNGLNDPSEAKHNAEENMRNSYSIHFHVWTAESFKEMLQAARNHLQIKFVIEHFEQNGSEVIALLRKP